MLFIIYAVVTALTVLFAVYMILWYRKKVSLFELTEETTGIITKMTKGSLAVSPKPKGQVYNIKVNYTINGTDYKTNMQCEEGDPALSEGQAVTVLYDPKNPSRAIPKDFKREHAEYYWRMLVILAVILCVIAFCITIFTLPNTLGLSNEEEKKFKIGRNAFFVIAMPIAYHFVRRSESYKAEVERDPKEAKKTFFTALALWGNFLISLIFDIVFYVIL
ncbi:MAG: DUF3592 domain-containing protein [Ruminococcus sp.]|nr:DUF3592 domain-containing protein [Ruminococcus sp.]